MYSCAVGVRVVGWGGVEVVGAGLCAWSWGGGVRAGWAEPGGQLRLGCAPLASQATTRLEAPAGRSASPPHFVVRPMCTMQACGPCDQPTCGPPRPQPTPRAALHCPTAPPVYPLPSRSVLRTLGMFGSCFEKMFFSPTK